MPKTYIIGVFDSGIGGLSVANAIEQALPEQTIIFKNDRSHVPYGNRSPQEIYRLIKPIFQSFVDEGCDVVVVACNTVSTTLITDLRANFALPMVAMEPMVKPAAQLSNSKIIAVCATPTTLGSERYTELKRQYAANVKVIEPNCSDWTQLIENNELHHQRIEKDLQPALNAGADVIVLGCTHYHWIEQDIVKMTKGQATVLQPEAAVISQLKRVLSRLPETERLDLYS